MAISIDFPMFDMTNKLSKSADALDSALAHMSKKTASPFASGISGLDNTDDLFSSSPVVSATAGSGFDEWLAADLQFGNLSGDESILSSSPLSSSSASPFSSLEDSPLLGFESFNGASALMMSAPLFDMSIIPSVMVDVSLPVPAPDASATPALTSAAVQQAAAALNIPWSSDLEKAVMAQAQADLSTAAQVVLSPLLAIQEDDIADFDFSRESSREASPSPAFTSTESSSPSLASATLPAPAGKKKSKKRVLSPEEKMEEVVAKRAKNTDAARRSRLKKLIRLEGLEAKVSDLETVNNDLSMKIAILETEKSGFVSKEAEQFARIEQLEAQLAEAHAALSKRP
ncbi:hypothetical protein CPC16_003314 [Podila verticillata]|nr:hypothetical protein BGZ52_006627 [Haplosporangium bisporale]KAF9202604.1 hypothetical protein BGZ59_002076 [Podila verticillata]KAF9371047.1 hypothetical protein CPC16_003314 [Podila verticillata]KFH70793.1 hypothetical protein MVEG_03641 [Podila verticillata NRRL 6337]